MNRRAFGALAAYYDRLNAGINYAIWADYINTIIMESGRGNTSLVLDMACGTGNMTVALARLGYDMIGLDLSEDMLSIAQQRAVQNELDILYIKQDMSDFELYGTVDAAVCCLDGINYITDPRRLERCFSRVYGYLNPGGLFIFDVNTPHKFKNIFGKRDYILESNGVLCAWRNDYDEQSGICRFELSLFAEDENGLYRRFDEVQTERRYTKLELEGALCRCGLEVVDIGDGPKNAGCGSGDERWHFICRRQDKSS